MLRSRLPNHDLLLQIASPDRPDKDFFYGFSTLRELQFTEASVLVMEPWQRSDELWDRFNEEGKNLGEKQHQMLGLNARIYGELTFLNYSMMYVHQNEQAMKSQIKSDVEESQSVKFKVWSVGAFENKNIHGVYDVRVATDTSIR